MNDYFQQFFICERSDHAPSGWPQIEFSDYILSHCPRLPVVSVCSESNERLGFLIGHAFSTSGELQTDTVNINDSGQGRDAVIRGFVRSLSGRFVLIVYNQSLLRVYPDAAATLAFVYSAQLRRIASTASLLLHDEPSSPLFCKTTAEFPCGGNEWFYPGGLTPEPDIKRVLPNHYLDTNSYETFRFTYGEKITECRSQELAHSIDIITRLLQTCIKGVVENFSPVYMGLTAGQDTRILLACARPYVDRITFVTFDYSHWYDHRTHKIDVHTASTLAKRFGLRHKLLQIKQDVSPDIESWYIKQMGYAAGAFKARDFFQACENNLDLNGAWINGFYGEIGRFYLGNENDKADDKFDSREILKRLHLPDDASFVAPVSAWLTQLSEINAFQLLDLAYIEQKHGCLTSPRLYGAARFRLNVIPFAQPSVYDHMLRLPVWYRRGSRVYENIVTKAWPELLDYRINDHINFADRLKERAKWKWNVFQRLTGIR